MLEIRLYLILNWSKFLKLLVLKLYLISLRDILVFYLRLNNWFLYVIGRIVFYWIILKVLLEKLLVLSWDLIKLLKILIINLNLILIERLHHLSHTIIHLIF